MISVIIPTMWQSNLLPKMIDKFISCDIVSEVLIIDNNPDYSLPVNDKANIIYSGKNLFVNPSWNLGVNYASSDYVLIVNDDLFIDNISDVLHYLSDNIQHNQIIGLDFSIGDFVIIPCSQYSHKNNFQGWGSFLFLEKSDYTPIPDDLLIWYGDNYLWEHLIPCVLKGIVGYHTASTTINSFDIKHITDNDTNIYHQKYSNKSLLKNTSGPLGPFSSEHSANICHIIMSCNRPQYLIPTLNSIHKIDFAKHKVHRVLVDDYPKNRNNEFFTRLAFTYGIDELILNTENKGLSVVWSELYEILKNRGYDYILHQEDDVVLLHPININQWCDILVNYKPNVCSAVLTRQPWYPGEDPFIALPNDHIIHNYRVEYRDQVFSPMFSLYRSEIMEEPFIERWGVNLNEGMIMQHLREKGMQCAYIKTQDGDNMIAHIGDHFTGRRILPGEPGWEQFKNFDPNKTYCSRTGQEIIPK